MITFAHHCPYCGTENTAFEVKGFNRFQDRKQGVDTFALFATCNKCGHGVVGNALELNKVMPNSRGFTRNKETLANAVERQLAESLSGMTYALEAIFPEHHIDFLPRPPDPAIPKHLPKSVEKFMRSAEKLYLKVKGDPDMIESSGNAYRRTVEEALAELDGGTDKNLNQRINQLVAKGLLVKSMGDFAHRIRVLGNAATHDELTLGELEELRTFIQLFLQYTFTLPAMIPVEK